MNHELKNVWNRYFQYSWKFGLFLILLVCVPRFYLVLRANQLASYGSIGLIMFVSALVPFLFLNKYGRKQIGIVRTQKIKWVLIAFLTGIMGSFLLYLAGKVLFGSGVQNWYVYIGKSYNISEDIDARQKFIQFVVMATTGMIFSPIGEELFFRGIVHGSFAKSIGEKKASIVDSSAFALTHLSHFGLVYVNLQWDFYFVPALLWVISMFLVSLLFFMMKKKSGSIWGAVLCHAGFNLGMIFSIFYLL
ncbi:MAG TPA: type II CAAX endopeptidase family protein [Draconibacterium sp.]|nr:type II CAAX endopeptidase family protein [Draconibacterium sp.]